MLTILYYVLGAMVLALSVLLYKMISFRKLLEKKNVRLIQFYLDSKFIWNGMINNLMISQSEDFCLKMISDIKDYYHLENIIIIDSVKMTDKSKNTTEKSAIFKYLLDNDRMINKKISKERMYVCKIKINESDFTIYVSSLTFDMINDGYIICLEKTPSLLDEHEIISLESAVNLLKSRLIYD